jgi:hypothetical protein
MDDLDTLTPPVPQPWKLGGAEYPAKPLTLGRLATARRFGVALQPVLEADDMFDVLERDMAMLVGHFAVATGVPASAFDEAPLDEAMAAFFRLAQEVADFTTGPLARTVVTGLIGLAMRRTAPNTAPAGEAGLPGLSDADTGSTS